MSALYHTIIHTLAVPFGCGLHMSDYTCDPEQHKNSGIAISVKVE